jgi:ethanolamine utilization protein EutA
MKLSPENIDTGALIITGEAARKDNARQIAELLSDQAGKFVCATAGPKLEAVLAAHGSGSVIKSRDNGLSLLNIDLGGATTKISLIHNGIIREVTALNIGARLLATDSDSHLIRIEKAGQRFLADLGLTLTIGDTLDVGVMESLAARMVSILFDVLQGRDSPFEELFILPPLATIDTLDGLVFSGGVSEYVYNRERDTYGDLGALLGREIEKQVAARGYSVLDSAEGIRATVIGASQYSIQLSGDTLSIPHPSPLPLHNLRIVVSKVGWEPPIADRACHSIKQTLARLDRETLESPFALAVSSPPFLGYGAAQELGKAIKAVLLATPAEERPRALIFNENIGRVVGQLLSAETKIPCIDEVSLSELDFIDVGSLTEDGYVPVVIKSLAFGV